jgi:hypothetical protein
MDKHGDYQGAVKRKYVMSSADRRPACKFCHVIFVGVHHSPFTVHRSASSIFFRWRYWVVEQIVPGVSPKGVADCLAVTGQ